MSQQSTADDSAKGPGILAGIKVVELAQNAAIPHCGRLLAGLGADVVKVEPPEGDAMRGLAEVAPGEGKAFATINPGKRGIAVDLGSADAAEVVDGLFAWADIVLVAFKQADLVRYGIDWDHAKTINPRLVYLTLSAFGPEGPAASQGGYDVLVQGRSGLGFVMNRSSNGTPEPTRPAIFDFGTGITSAFAVMAALRHRDLTGEGQRVDTSLLGAAMNLGTPILADFPAADTEAVAALAADIEILRKAGLDFDTQRDLYESRVLTGKGLFRLYFRHYATADGLISVAGASAGLMRKFHDVTGLDKPAIGDPSDQAFIDVVDAAEALFASRTTAEWVEIFGEVGYPCGPYNMPHEALVDPQVLANDYVVELDHPAFGPYTTTGMPVRFEKSTAEISGPSPQFGADTRDVLHEIGIDAERIDRLVVDAVVLDGPRTSAD